MCQFKAKAHENMACKVLLVMTNNFIATRIVILHYICGSVEVVKKKAEKNKECTIYCI